MTSQCAVCGESDELLRNCKYCSGVYCADHALPENHDCPGLVEIESQEGWVRDHRTRVPTCEGEDVESRPEPLGSSEITTYGSVEPDFESSPDVAVDGSIIGEDDGDDDKPDGNEGFLPKLISSLKFWS